MPQQKERNITPKNARRGVTLIEIAIVLVIVGIVLGGVLKGQEIINNSRVKALANRQQSIVIAWHSFIAKYGAMPGDYVFASERIPGAPDAHGFYNPGDGIIVQSESPIAFQNLSAAGFLRCPQCTTTDASATNADLLPSTQNSPLNSYGGVMAVFHDNILLVAAGIGPITSEGLYAYRGDGDSEPALMSHSGQFIPSNIVAQVDLKIDDGIANTGDLVFNIYGSNTAAPHARCISSSAVEQRNPPKISSPDLLWWRHISVAPDANCGFSLYL